MIRSKLVLAAAALLAITGPAAARFDPEIPAIEKRMRAAEAAGDLAGMLAQAQRLEAIVKARFGTRHLNYAIVRNNVGNAYEMQGRYAEAEAAYRETITVLETLPKQRDRELAAAVPGQLAGTLRNLANLYQHQGRLAESEAGHRRALAILERTEPPAAPLLVQCRRDLADTLQGAGRFDEAEAMLRGVLAVQERNATRNQPAEAELAETQAAETQAALASVLLEHGKLDEAQAQVERALPVQERPGTRPGVLVSTLNTLAGIESQRGRSARAADILKRILAIQERLYGPANPKVAPTLNNLANVLYDQNQLADAEGLHRRALAIREASLAPDNPDIAQSLNGLSVVYRAQGRNADAITAIERAIPIYTKALGPDHPVIAGIQENLGIAQWALGRLDEAERTFRRVLAIQERVRGPDHTDLAGTLANLGIVCNDQALKDPANKDRAKLAEAERALERAAGILEKALGPQNPQLIAPLVNLAGAYRRDDKAQRALDTSRRASAVILAQVPVAEAGAADGGAALLHGHAASLTQHLSSLALAEGDRSDRDADHEMGREAFRIAQWAGQSAAAGALQQTNARFAAGDGKLAALIREVQDLAAARQNADRALTAALTATSTASGADAGTKRLRADLDALVAKFTAADAALASAYPDYAALAHPQPLEIEAAQALLGEDEALVMLVPGSEESFVFALTRDRFAWHAIPWRQETLEKDVALFRIGLDLDALAKSIAAGKPERFDLLSASNFYTKLLSTVEPVFKDRKRLLFVPVGALSAVPFHLLVTEKPAEALPQDMAGYRDAAWLARSHAVSVLPSVGSLAALRSLARRPEGAKPMVGFGDPILGAGSGESATGAAPTSGIARVAVTTAGAARGYGAFWQGAGVDRALLAEALPPLPETAEELRRVAERLGAPASDLHLGAGANETAVKTLPLAEYRVVYFATHGLVAGDVKGLGEPSLVLSLPAQQSARDDGLLTASEVAQLRLGADWVVLSACNTAAGDKPGADALSGLARAFFYAGSRALLVSHWAVDSAAAARLTTATFDLLQADPALGRSEALRRAMLDQMNDGSDPKNAYPAYWGPFVVIGDVK